MQSICITYNTMKNTTKGSAEVGIITSTNISLAYAKDMENMRNLLACRSISIHVTTRGTTTTKHQLSICGVCARPTPAPPQNRHCASLEREHRALKHCPSVSTAYAQYRLILLLTYKLLLNGGVGSCGVGDCMCLAYAQYALKVYSRAAG